MKDMKTLRATPIEMALRSPDEMDDVYPDGHWVRAATDLILPPELLYPDANLKGVIYCQLFSPGKPVGGKAGGDQEAAFVEEAVALTRLLTHLDIIIAEES